jgi:hypothetical protein
MDTLRLHPWAGLGSSGHAFGPTLEAEGGNMKHQAYQDPIAEAPSGQATPSRSRVEEGRTETSTVYLVKIAISHAGSAQRHVARTDGIAG